DDPRLVAALRHHHAQRMKDVGGAGLVDLALVGLRGQGDGAFEGDHPAVLCIGCGILVRRHRPQESRSHARTANRGRTSATRQIGVSAAGEYFCCSLSEGWLEKTPDRACSYSQSPLRAQRISESSENQI